MRHLPSRRCSVYTAAPVAPVTLVVLVAVASGCADVVEGPDFEATDSAGVALALSRQPSWDDGFEWALSASPTLEIGAQTGADEDLFSQVVGAARLGDAALLVCNGDDRTLRYYGPDGTFLRRSAGQGEGPEELRFLSRCIHRDGETWAYQAPTLPIKVFDESGAFVRSVVLPRPGDRVAQVIDVAADGSLLLRQDAPRRGLDAGVSILSTWVIRSTADGSTLDTVGTFDGGLWMRGDRVAFPAAFSPTLAALFWDDLVVVSWPERFDLALFDSTGALTRRIRTTTEPLEVEASDRRAFEDRILNGPMPAGDTPYQSEEIRRLIVEMMVYPEALPVHYRAIVSGDGHLWLERGDAPRDPLPQVAEPYRAPTTWDVFDREGKWLGGVSLPAGFEPLEVGGTYVLGVHHDELGVERLRLYHLTKAVVR